MGKNRKKLGTKDNCDTGGWEIVYSGFVLILLCFFVMLCAFSSVQEAKIFRFVRSFVEALSIFPGGLKFESGNAVLKVSEDIVEADSELASMFNDLQELTNELGISDRVQLDASDQELEMTLTDDVLFRLGVAEISPEGIILLRKIGELMDKSSLSLRVEGHTDNLPIHTEKYPSNWELSTARAVNVVRYLMKAYKIAPGRLTAAGYGEFQPLLPNDTPEHRAKNRRVKLVFLEKEEEEEEGGNEH